MQKQNKLENLESLMAKGISELISKQNVPEGKQMVFTLFTEKQEVVIKPVIINEDGTMEPKSLKVNGNEYLDFSFYELIVLLMGGKKSKNMLLLNSVLPMIEAFIPKQN